MIDNDKIRTLAQKCFINWNKIKPVEEIEKDIMVFLSQFNDSEVQGIVYTLIEQFKYYNMDEIRNVLIWFNNELFYELKIPIEDVLLSRIESDSKINSSNAMLSEFKLSNLIQNNYSHDLFKIDKKKLSKVGFIIFFDDIIGSGSTIVEFFEDFLNKNKGFIFESTIIICCIEIMEIAEDRLNRYFKERNINYFLIYKYRKLKAFKTGHIFQDDVKLKRKLIKNIESQVSKKFKKSILGYNQSEALVAFSHNTPNNTLSIFWSEGHKKFIWIPLFTRNNKNPKWMNDNHIPDKKSRDNAIYNLKARIGGKNNES